MRLSDGCEIYRVTHGAGIPMVTLHGGMGLDHTAFRPYLDALGDVCATEYFDQRGNGRSDGPPPVDSIAQWAADVEDLRTRAGLGRIVLFGHSFGAFLALEYARRFGEQLAGLVLCAAGASLAHAGAAMETARLRTSAAQYRALEALLTHPPHDDETFRAGWQAIRPLYFHRYEERFGEAFDRHIRYRAAAFVAAMQSVGSFDATPWLRSVQAPTLLITGRSDWLMPPELGAEPLRASLPRAELAVIEEAGHFPFIERPAEFESVLRAWLGRL